MGELRRLLLALGPVVAAVGLVVFAMGLSYREPRDFEVQIGIGLMIGGVVGALLGWLLYRTERDPAEEHAPTSEHHT